MKKLTLIVLMAGVVLVLALAVASPARADDPTETPTPTPTDTPTPTATATATSTPTDTPTPTPTWAPGAYIIWADPVVSIDSDMLADIEAVLLADAPSGSSGPLYAVTDASSSDGDWIISITNLLGVDPPYTDWNWENNANWAGALECSGTDPDWLCDYYEPPALGGSSTMVLFPWRPGTKAVYGILGVHDGLLSMPGSSAVDFVGGDNMGTSIMPPNVYAAEAGTVTSVCRDANNIGVRITGNNQFGYYHLAPTTSIDVGDTFKAGQQIGILVYGSFDNLNCGFSSQGNSVYHLHFAFMHDGDGYFQMGGCVLNTNTEYWLCGTQSIGVRGLLANGGDSGIGSIIPGEDGTPTTSALGGEHIWDGIINGIVSMVHNFAVANFPPHTAIGIEDAVLNAITSYLAVYSLISMSGLIWLTPALVIIGFILTLELVRWAYVLYRTVVRIIPMP